MLFLFEDKDGELYDNPDSYVMSLPHSVVRWGDELKIHPVYAKGQPVYHGYQTIKVMFYHEGSTSTLGETYWVSDKNNSSLDNKNWYESIILKNKVSAITKGRVVRFDMGDSYPKYFSSAEDLGWYISNIYSLCNINITDECGLREKI